MRQAHLRFCLYQLSMFASVCTDVCSRLHDGSGSVGPRLGVGGASVQTCYTQSRHAARHSSRGTCHASG